jgi:hypothetical protein
MSNADNALETFLNAGDWAGFHPWVALNWDGNTYEDEPGIRERIVDVQLEGEPSLLTTVWHTNMFSDRVTVWVNVLQATNVDIAAQLIDALNCYRNVGCWHWGGDDFVAVRATLCHKLVDVDSRLLQNVLTAVLMEAARHHRIFLGCMSGRRSLDEVLPLLQDVGA